MLMVGHNDPKDVFQPKWFYIVEQKIVLVKL